MATATLLQTLETETTETDYDTPSVTWGSSVAGLLIVGSRETNNPTVPTPSGGWSTWTPVVNGNSGTVAGGAVWVGTGTKTDEPVHLDYGSDTQLMVLAFVFGLTDCPTSGTIVETGSWATATGTSISPSISSVAADSLLIGIAMHNNNNLHSSESGWAEAGDINIGASFFISMVVATRSGNGDTSYTASWTSSTGAGGVVLELLHQAGSTDATVTPGVIAAVAAVPTATKSTGSTVSPSAIAATTATPTATASTGSTVSPATIAATTATLAATTSAGSTATPATITVTATVPTANPGSSANVTPDTIAATASLPAATPSAGSTVAPDTISASTSLPAASTATGSTVAAQTITATASLPAPSVSAAGNVTITPSTISCVAALPAPTPSASSTVSPAVIQATASLLAASLSTGSTVSPSVVAALVSVLAPSVTTPSAEARAAISVALTYAYAVNVLLTRTDGCTSTATHATNVTSTAEVLE